MLRNLGAVVAGLVVGMIVNMALVLLNSFVLFPMPPGTSFADPEAMRAYIATLPVQAFVLVILAHLGQAFVGGGVAAWLSARAPVVAALIVGVISLIAGVMNLRDLGGPTWMWAELPLYLVAAWAAGTLVQRRREA